MSKVDLSKYARFPQVPYIAEDGNTKHYPSLSWCEQEPDGTIVCDVRKVPRVAAIYPPLMECDERKCYNRWLQYDFVIYPNYELEEVGEDYAVVRRTDGVRFKVVGRVDSKILLELARYPNGVELFDILPILIGWIAVVHPERYKNPADELIAEDAGIVIVGLGSLYYELGLIDLKRVR
jgi:hypothetical protein